VQSTHQKTIGDVLIQASTDGRHPKPINSKTSPSAREAAKPKLVATAA
jgi:hypothetical protein